MVDFGDLLETLPNYYVLGQNIKLFASKSVTGIFEEGQQHGGRIDAAWG